MIFFMIANIFCTIIFVPLKMVLETHHSFPPNFEVCISYGYLGWWFLSVIKLMALSRQMVGLVQKSAFLVMNLLNTQYLNSG